MRIPLEHFSATPVITLSPNVAELDQQPQRQKSLRERVTSYLSPSAEAVPDNDDEDQHQVQRRPANSVGSAPTSPSLRRKKATSCVFEDTDTAFGNFDSNLAATHKMTSSLTSFDRAEVDEEYDDVDASAGAGPVSLPYGMGAQPKSGSYFKR